MFGSGAVTQMGTFSSGKTAAGFGPAHRNLDPRQRLADLFPGMRLPRTRRQSPARRRRSERCRCRCRRAAVQQAAKSTAAVFDSSGSSRSARARRPAGRPSQGNQRGHFGRRAALELEDPSTLKVCRGHLPPSRGFAPRTPLHAHSRGPLRSPLRSRGSLTAVRSRLRLRAPRRPASARCRKLHHHDAVFDPGAEGPGTLPRPPANRRCRCRAAPSRRAADRRPCSR